MKHFAIHFLIIITFGRSSFSQDNNAMVRMSAIHDFPILNREGTASNRKPYSPFHIEKDLNALAGDDLNFTFHMAAAEGVFPGEAGKYSISLNTLTERDGECVYNVYVNDEQVGLFQQNPPTNEFAAPATLQWTGILIPAHARIRVESNNWSNLKRHEGNFFEYARGRWTSIDFIPENNGTNSIRKDAKVGIFEEMDNSGPEDFTAEAIYNKNEEAYYLKSAGGKQGNEPGIGFLVKNVNKNFTLETFLTLMDFAGNRNYNAGLMIRQSMDPDAPFIACNVQGNGHASLQYKEDQGSEIKEIPFTVTGAEMIQLGKNGNIYTISVTKYGLEYERRSIEMSGLTGVQKAGFYVVSNKDNDREIIRFSHVRFFEELGP